MVGSTEEGPNFAQSTLLSRGVVLRQLWTQHGFGCLGVKLPPKVNSLVIRINPLHRNIFDVNMSNLLNKYFHT